MKEIKEQNLKRIKGGLSIWTILLAVTSTIFTAGIFDGIARPFGCRS